MMARTKATAEGFMLGMACLLFGTLLGRLL